MGDNPCLILTTSRDLKQKRRTLGPNISRASGHFSFAPSLCGSPDRRSDLSSFRNPISGVLMRKLVTATVVLVAFASNAEAHGHHRHHRHYTRGHYHHVGYSG